MYTLPLRWRFWSTVNAHDCLKEYSCTIVFEDVHPYLYTVTQTIQLMTRVSKRYIPDPVLNTRKWPSSFTDRILSNPLRSLVQMIPSDSITDWMPWCLGTCTSATLPAGTVKRMVIAPRAARSHRRSGSHLDGRAQSSRRRVGRSLVTEPFPTWHTTWSHHLHNPTNVDQKSALATFKRFRCFLMYLFSFAVWWFVQFSKILTFS